MLSGFTAIVDTGNESLNALLSIGFFVAIGSDVLFVAVSLWAALSRYHSSALPGRERDVRMRKIKILLVLAFVSLLVVTWLRLQHRQSIRAGRDDVAFSDQVHKLAKSASQGMHMENGSVSLFFYQ